MLRHSQFLIVFSLSLFTNPAWAQNYVLNKVWETEKEFLTPESAVYDETRNQLYISNYNRFPRDLESADDFISILDMGGNILELKWITGLKAPTGVTIYHDHLYIVERDGISKYEIETGGFVKKYKINAPGFLNDIAIDEEGIIYFTDTSPRIPEASSVNEIREGIVDTVASEPINRSNGLLYHNRSLLVGNSGDQCLKKIDLETNTVIKLAQLDTGIIDGIKYYKADIYIVTQWEGRVYLISSGGGVNELLDLRSDKIKTADIEFIQKLNLVIIPTFDNNSVIAYRIEEEY